MFKVKIGVLVFLEGDFVRIEKVKSYSLKLRKSMLLFDISKRICETET
jgi:hypothetical protein